MQRAIISIGVRKTGGLPELQAAQESAKAMAGWARAHQGIPASRVKLITDEKTRVTRDRIFDAVEAITKLGYVEQLIVYFSGHGINSGHHEQWLLSRAPDDPVAAVNVKGSEMLARFCGIGHVVFISDACRTAADSIQAQGITGGEIFPNSGAQGVEKPVDQFYATLVGRPAFEVKTVEAAVARYAAAYTHVLLEALSGTVPALVEQDGDQRVVRPWPLKKHLALAVPEYMGTLKLPGGESQQPDARIESEPDSWLSTVPAADKEAAPARAKPAKKAGVPRRSTATRGGAALPPSASPAGTAPVLSGDEPLPPPSIVGTHKRPADLVTDARAALLGVLDADIPTDRKRSAPPTRAGARGGRAGAPRQALEKSIATASEKFGPDHLETQCGIKVRGARIDSTLARHADAHVGHANDVIRIALHDNRRGTNVMVKVADGSLVMVPALRDYLTALTFDADGNLDDVSFEPSANTPRFQLWQQNARELGALRAVIAAASSLGVFRLDDVEEGAALLARLRRMKTLDPALAVYAAYAFHDRRMRAEIVDMQRFLDTDLGARIFDVALLAFSLGKGRAKSPVRELYPCVPMLTQGWSLLSPLGVELPGRLGELRRLLRPSLWTHFTPAAADVLIETLKDGPED
ncbi:MAG: hypothetical protein V4617_17880 [Gemmatimonadota bacterium]